MACNGFQRILSNIHLVDNNIQTTDPLAKIRPFIDMCDMYFKRVYSPEKELSFDEGCCPYKGRLRFKVYNPMKPNRFHIKLFQVCEAISGYIVLI